MRPGYEIYLGTSRTLQYLESGGVAVSGHRIMLRRGAALTYVNSAEKTGNWNNDAGFDLSSYNHRSFFGGSVRLHP